MKMILVTKKCSYNASWRKLLKSGEGSVKGGAYNISRKFKGCVNKQFCANENTLRTKLE